MNGTLYTPKQLAKLFGVTPESLARWEKEGKIEAKKTPGGHRRYVYHEPVAKQSTTDKLCYAYARVSSPKQKGDLQRQVDVLQAACPTHHVVQDVGSGINFKRRGLLSILDSVFAGRVQEVVVAHRDRLSRFGFDLFKHIFGRFGVSIRVLSDSDVKEPVNELAQDLLSIVTVFTARYYGTRSYRKMSKGEDLPNRRTGYVVQQMPRRFKVLLQPGRKNHQRHGRQRNRGVEKEDSSTDGDGKRQLGRP